MQFTLSMGGMTDAGKHQINRAALSWATATRLKHEECWMSSTSSRHPILSCACTMLPQMAPPASAVPPAVPHP
jgi:hypothetical protein